MSSLVRSSLLVERATISWPSPGTNSCCFMDFFKSATEESRLWTRTRSSPSRERTRNTTDDPAHMDINSISSISSISSINRLQGREFRVHESGPRNQVPRCTSVSSIA